MSSPAENEVPGAAGQPERRWKETKSCPHRTTVPATNSPLCVQLSQLWAAFGSYLCQKGTVSLATCRGPLAHQPLHKLQVFGWWHGLEPQWSHQGPCRRPVGTVPRKALFGSVLHRAHEQGVLLEARGAGAEEGAGPRREDGAGAGAPAGGGALGDTECTITGGRHQTRMQAPAQVGRAKSKTEQGDGSGSWAVGASRGGTASVHAHAHARCSFVVRNQWRPRPGQCRHRKHARLAKTLRACAPQISLHCAAAEATDSPGASTQVGKVTSTPFTEPAACSMT